MVIRERFWNSYDKKKNASVSNYGHTQNKKGSQRNRKYKKWKF